MAKTETVLPADFAEWEIVLVKINNDNHDFWHWEFLIPFFRADQLNDHIWNPTANLLYIVADSHNNGMDIHYSRFFILELQ